MAQVMEVKNVESHTEAEAHTTIRLSVEDQQRLAELLLNPPKLSPSLERAKQFYSQLVRKPI